MYRIFYLSLLIILARIIAQENLNYQQPPNEILNLVDVKLPPRVLMDENKKYMVCIYRDAFKTIKENKLGDINFWVDSKGYNIVEMTHHIWLLAIVDYIIGDIEYPPS